ncbi:MAG: ATP-binding protein, partial [Caulobacterales bacterium]|nr:ATP-binding protein [Caulobacterales bacterium]
MRLEGALQNLYMYTCDAVCVFEISHAGGPDAKLVFANQAFLILSDCTLGEILGAPVRDFWHCDTSRHVIADIEEAMSAQKSIRREMFLTRKQAAPVSVDQAFFPVNDGGGRYSHWIAVSRDITEQKRQHAELKRARADADKASRAKSAFLANMSHEIRTPMNGILGMATALAREELTDTQRKRLDIITSSGDALMRIIDDVLDLSKIEAGRMEIENAPFALDELLASIEALYALRADEKGIEFAVRLAPAAETRLLGDATRIRQVLSNLISNAVKFTEAGSVEIAVGTAPASDGEGIDLSFTVSDCGPGIAPDVAERLFTPFTQADVSTTRTHGGTGLGLAISRQLCELMHGSISLQSEPGQGAVFHAVVRVGRAVSMDGVAAPRAEEPLEDAADGA